MKGPMQGLDRARPKKEETLQLVAFSVGDGEYALDIMRIKEIINPVKVTQVPKAPAFIEGVIELRGAILPIVDLRKRFDLPPIARSRANKFLIVAIEVNGKRMVVGLMADSVLEPLRITPAEVRPAPSLTQGGANYFTNVVHHEKRIFMILDVDALLSQGEKVTLSGLDGSSA